MSLTATQRRRLQGLRARHAARLGYVARYGHCPVDAQGSPLLGALPDLDALLDLCAELAGGRQGAFGQAARAVASPPGPDPSRRP
jgi:hypothetical protein